MRESHVTIPDVALLYTDTHGVPLHQVLPMLRQRAELGGTHWLAVGSQGLGEMLGAGADALISDVTPPKPSRCRSARCWAARNSSVTRWAASPPCSAAWTPGSTRNASATSWSTCSSTT